MATHYNSDQNETFLILSLPNKIKELWVYTSWHVVQTTTTTGFVFIVQYLLIVVNLEIHTFVLLKYHSLLIRNWTSYLLVVFIQKKNQKHILVHKDKKTWWKNRKNWLQPSTKEHQALGFFFSVQQIGLSDLSIKKSLHRYTLTKDGPNKIHCLY